MNGLVTIGAALVILGGAGYYELGYLPASREAQADASMEAAGEVEPQATLIEVDEPVVVDLPGVSPATRTAEMGVTSTPVPTGGSGPLGTAPPGSAADDARSGVDPALTTAGFNADAVLLLIDGSTLDASQKASLTAEVRDASSDPARIGPVLERVRAALGQ